MAKGFMGLLKSVFAVSVFIALAAVGALAGSSSAWAASTVNVTMVDMALKLDRNTVPAGKVTFKATNKSASGLTHEMLVVKVNSKLPKLPYDKKANSVSEDKIHSLGEISETKAGQKGSLTLDMKHGTYLLFCNIPGHFAVGMKTLFYVK